MLHFRESIVSRKKKNAYVAKYRRFLGMPQIEKQYADEYTKITKTLKRSTGGLSNKAGLVLYNTIRTKKPELVLETGVDEGYSSALILNALNRNGGGKLVSIDVRNDVGSLTKGMDINRWRLVIREPSNALKQTLDEMDNIDIFLHDSDHSYENMKFEFESIFPKLNQEGILFSDDVGDNNAFMEFSESKGLKPLIIDDCGKVFGMLAANRLG